MDNDEATEGKAVIALVDVTSFCKACQDKSNRETFDMLDRFYGLVHNVIDGAGGSVVKFMGDGALVFFPCDKANQAVAALQDLEAKSRPIWSDFNVDCVVQTKAHAGSVVAGPIGPDRRFDVIGNTVNELFLMPWDGPRLSEELRTLMEG